VEIRKPTNDSNPAEGERPPARTRRRGWLRGTTLAALGSLVLYLLTDVCRLSAQGSFALGQPGEGISFGRFTLHPFLNATFSYDDNIFYDDIDPKSDFYLVASPGLNLEYPWSRNIFRFTYRADCYFFSRYSEVDDVDQFLRAALDYYFYKHGLFLQDVFFKTYSRDDTEFTERIKRYENTGSIRISQYFNAWTLTLGYQHYLQHFITEPYWAYDHQEHTATLDGRYKISPKLRALVEYDYSYIAYDYDRDLDRDGYYNQILGGCEGQLAAKLSGTVKVGYQAREYYSKSLADFNSPVGFISLDYAMSSSARLFAGWERTARESTFTDNNYYTLNRAWARYEQQLTYKAVGALECSYRNLRYPAATTEFPDRRRNDDIWRFTAEFRYPLQKWLTLAAAYSHQIRESNLPGLDYRDNEITLKIASFY